MMTSDKILNRQSNKRISTVQNKAFSRKLYLIISLILLADFSLFISIELNDSVIFVLALVPLLIALFFSSAVASFSREVEIIQTGKFLSIIAAFTFVSVSLPSFGDAYIDILVIAILFFVALLLSCVSFVDRLPHKLLVVVIALVVSIVFGIIGSYALSGTITRVIRKDLFLPLLPIAFLFGYMEEVFFRSGLQKSLEPISSRIQAIVFPALLDAGLNALWSSTEFCIIVFVLAVIMGVLYSKFHFVTLNGISRSVESGLVIGLAIFF